MTKECFVRVFLTPELQRAAERDLSTEKIIKEFRRYKKSGDPGSLFGRDADFGRPKDAVLEELRHIHLMKDLPIQAAKIRSQFATTSDSFLIYCPGVSNKNDFLLIDILWDDAHDRVRNIDVMNEYAVIAERFRRER